MKPLLLIIFTGLALTGCRQSTMKLTSSAFENNGTIPSAFTCDGLNISPPLTISGVPASAKALALTMVDPDAPGGHFTHWIWWNLSPSTTEIKPGELPSPATEGQNSAGKPGYTGPCPPTGTHHYVFTLFALDSELPLSPEVKFDDLNQEIATHVIDQSELVGTYSHSQ